MAELLRSDALGAPHGFSTGAGATAQDVIPGGALVTVRQVHSPRCVRADAPWPSGEEPQADAIATDRPDLVLGIVTADCAPVLLADAEAGVIGAAHAGWRGAHGGVIARTVEAMAGLGADPARIAAAIGPCIAQASYEVDEAFRAQFAEEDARFFAPGARPGHELFDLPAYVAARLEQAGVGSIDVLGCDTYTDPERFYSYRRATHLGQPTGGRQISLIGLHREG